MFDGINDWFWLAAALALAGLYMSWGSWIQMVEFAAIFCIAYALLKQHNDRK